MSRGEKNLDDAAARLRSDSAHWQARGKEVTKALSAFGEASVAVAESHKAYEDLLVGRQVSGEGRCKECNKKLFESCIGGRVLIVCSRCKTPNVFEGADGVV